MLTRETKKKVVLKIDQSFEDCLQNRGSSNFTPSPDIQTNYLVAIYKRGKEFELPENTILKQACINLQGRINKLEKAEIERLHKVGPNE